MIRKAVIPAAGYGTRFLPLTKALPKELLPIIDRPTIEYIVNEAIESGITDILLIVSTNKNAIIDYFDYNLELEHILSLKQNYKEIERLREIGKGANIHFIRQKEQLGLGHAVLQAEAFIANEPFVVLLGDDMFKTKEVPATKQLIDVFKKVNSSVLGTMEVALEDTKKYGICIPKQILDNNIIELKGVVEKPKIEEAPSRSAIAGRYILTPTIFKYLKDQTKGVGNEIQLTDAILRMMKEEKVYSYNIKATRYDVGSKLDYIEAIIDYGLENPEIKEGLKNLIKKKSSNLQIK